MRRLLTALALLAGCVFAQDGVAPAMSWKDQAEFDIAAAAARAASPAEKLDSLDKWTAVYPETDNINVRLEMYLGAYQQLNPANPNFRAFIATVSQALAANRAPADFDAAQKAASLLLNSPDAFFSAADKPSGITEEQWLKAKAQTKPFAEQVLAAIDKLRSGGAFAAPQLNRTQVNPTPIQLIDPQYSEEARVAGLEGSVLVTGTIGDDGSMQGLRVSRPLGLGLDEQAIAAAAQSRFQPGSQHSVALPIDFVLPSKQSRWHLVGVEFKPPEGSSRPTFAKADYPFGSGISLAAYDEARLLAAIGRAATATVSFDIDERGAPGHFQVLDASAEVWGPEAVMVVLSWRFNPGMKAGMPISVPCTLKLIWGPEDFTASAIGNQIAQMHPPSASEPQERPKPLADSAIVFKTEPAYTEEARRAGVEGNVWISLRVDEQGAPVGVNVAGPLLGMGLETKAMEAVKQWRFQPVLLNGQPASVALSVQVHFRLSGVESSVFVAAPVAGALKR